MIQHVEANDVSRNRIVPRNTLDQLMGHATWFKNNFVRDQLSSTGLAYRDVHDCLCKKHATVEQRALPYTTI